MTRRQALALTALANRAVRAQSTPRPNIVLCMADDLGWGDTGYNGHPHLRTPHLDDMASRGLRFDRFYAGAPVCSPTRGSVLTGRHPYRYGIYTANAGHMRPEEATLAEILKDKGYTTGHFGKWHLGTLTNDMADGRRGGREKQHYAPPWEHGFDQCFSTEVQMPTWNPMQNQAFPSKYWTGPGQYATANLDGDDSRVIMDRALPFIAKAAAAGQPFFSVIWFHAPHLPVKAGPGHRALYREFSDDEQHYYGAITALDEQIGRLRGELRRIGAAANTMLWFCSDNGPEGRVAGQGVHRGSAGALRGRKRSLFEGGVRVPGLLEWPDRVKATRRTGVPCSTLDYLPTILSTLGVPLPAPRPIDGVDLRPILDGTAHERPRPIGFRTPRGDAAAKASRLGSPDHALIGNRYKLLSYLDDGAGEDLLFDIAVDPGERFDLAASQPAIARSMKAQLREWAESCKRSDDGRDYA
ncbi:MAG: sulfatase-like hydrolase/transferase [Bryobacteraceae bacterium]